MMNLNCLYLAYLSVDIAGHNCTTAATTNSNNERIRHTNYTNTYEGGKLLTNTPNNNNINIINNTETFLEDRGDDGGGVVVIDQLVSDEVAFYFEMTFWVFANALVSLVGTVANVINILVYTKMGLDDVVNVSLLGLAVSDLFSVSSIVWMGICYGLILLDPSGILFDPVTFMYVTAGWPHFIYSRVSCYITAMVSVERCMCVITPFKVNQLITPKRIKACLVFIFIAFPAAFIPTLMQHRMAWKFDARHNETRYMADFTEQREEIQANSYYAVGIVFPTLSFLIVTVCVVVTTQSLRKKMEWKMRNTTVSNVKATTKSTDKSKVKAVAQPIAGDINHSGVINTNAGSTKSLDSGDTNGKASDDELQSKIGDKSKNMNQTSTKELKVIQLLTVVCVMFLVCYSPSVFLNYVRLWIPSFGVFGPHHNLAVVVYSFVFLLSVTNSSCNIVVYYVMSTKYRDTFNSLFCGRSKVAK